MCHLMNTSIYDYAQIPAKIRERGDEFVGLELPTRKSKGYRTGKRSLLRARREPSVPMKAMVPAAGWGRGFRKVPAGSATRTDIAIMDCRRTTSRFG